MIAGKIIIYRVLILAVFTVDNNLGKSIHMYLICIVCYSSGWLLFSANSVIYQLYHGENMLIFHEMMRPDLY